MLRATTSTPTIAILGIRGIPAIHGGFETFAERLSLYLVGRGWNVTVYCQDETIVGRDEDTWNGVHRVKLPSKDDGPIASMQFDWQCITEVIRTKFDVTLTLGYNTAVFCWRLRMSGIPNAINMDGIEWARAKWSWPIKAWFYLNDWAGCQLGDKLIADHPEIKKLLRTRTRDSKIATIPYGADRVDEASILPLARYGLHPQEYITLIARPEPENSVLDIVRAFSRKRRGIKLCVLGRYDPKDAFHSLVLAAASDEVQFIGAVFDKTIVQSLRFHSLAYVHGHRVGGTNPSLVEALGAGNAVIAHDNRFNRWVADDAAIYFSSDAQCSDCFDKFVSDPTMVTRLRSAARGRHQHAFMWINVLESYEELLAGLIAHKNHEVNGPTYQESIL